MTNHVIAAWATPSYEMGTRSRGIPLGTYIYESATTDAGDVAVNLLGMLYFFETKNIRHKPERKRLFHSYGDSLSEHDMDFDWADETLHASYGKRWLKELLVARDQAPQASEDVRKNCEQLVTRYVGTATSAETTDLKSLRIACWRKPGNHAARSEIHHFRARCKPPVTCPSLLTLGKMALT